MYRIQDNRPQLHLVTATEIEAFVRDLLVLTLANGVVFIVREPYKSVRGLLSNPFHRLCRF